MIQKVLARYQALRALLVKECDHVKEGLYDPREPRQLVRDCPPLAVREGEEVLNAPAFLFRKERIAVWIVKRRNGHAPLEERRRVVKRSDLIWNHCSVSCCCSRC